MFQCQIHFSSSQATIWTLDDPLRYRILDHEALGDPDICLVYPPSPYPADAVILTFSCDGSHYLRYDEFLGKNASFWFGTPA